MPTSSKRPKVLLLAGHLALALQTRGSTTAGWLVRGRWRKNLAFCGSGMVGVLFDQLGHDAAQRLDAQGQGGHIQQQHVLDIALPKQQPWMAAAYGHHLIGVDPPCWAPWAKIRRTRSTHGGACGSFRPPG